MELDFYIKITISIVCIGTPILIQALSLLDNKYNSQLILKEFQKEKVTKIFITLIFLSLTNIILWTPYFSRLLLNESDFNLYHKWISSSLVIFVILLILSFLLLIYKTSIYYNPFKLHTNIISKFNRSYTTIEEKSHLRAIIHDQFFYSLISNNATLFESSYYFILTDYSNTIKNLNYINNSMPFALYEFQKKITLTTLLRQKNSEYIDLKLFVLATTQSLLRGSVFSEILLSNNTYAHIWNNLNYMIKEKAEDFLISYYNSAYQFFQFHSDLNFGYRSNKMFAEDKYFYFNIVICAKIYSNNISSVVDHIFKHTQSTFYSNNILPKTMDEVLNLFFTCNNIDFYIGSSDDYNFFHCFNDGIGFQNDAKVCNYINKFVAILFLRQWSITDGYGQSTIDINPSKFGEERNQYLIENLNQLKLSIESILSNSDIIKQFKWMELIDNSTQLEYSPSSVIGLYLDQLITTKKHRAENIELSQSKVDRLVESTKNNLSNYLDQLVLFNNSNIELNKHIILSNGITRILKKEPFTDNTNIEYVNFFDSPSKLLLRKLNIQLSNNFYWKSNNRFRIKREDIEPTFHLLHLKNYHIISFGGLRWKSMNKYKDRIISFPSHSDLIGQSLFFIKSDDLPNIKIQSDITKDDLYNFVKSDFQHNFNISIDDLNKNQKLANMLDSENPSSLYKSVCLHIKFQVSIKWKKNVNMTQIEIVPPFLNKGILNTPRQIFV